MKEKQRKQNIEILKAIKEVNSLYGAQEKVGLSYKTIWKRVNFLKGIYGDIIVSTAGGHGGGGTFLTSKGEELLKEWMDEYC